MNLYELNNTLKKISLIEIKINKLLSEKKNLFEQFIFEIQKELSEGEK